jgi:hypothetical protein
VDHSALPGSERNVSPHGKDSRPRCITKPARQSAPSRAGAFDDEHREVLEQFAGGGLDVSLDQVFGV